MELQGTEGRLLAPVGQRGTLLPVGRLGAWTATVQVNVYVVGRLGPLQGRAAEPAVITGRATGWRPHPFYWPAVATPDWQIELVEPGGLRWRLHATVTWMGRHTLTFTSHGPAECLPATGG